jgi:hypothetical protein
MRQNQDFFEIKYKTEKLKQWKLLIVAHRGLMRKCGALLKKANHAVQHRRKGEG